MAANVSLEDLVALNDEIAGLVRSGVPLDRGLAAWSRDVAGPLGRGAGELSRSMAEGQSLPEALQQGQLDLPPLYRAVVTAGIRGGRLPAALESLSGMARNLNQLRSSVLVALVYPLLLLLTAYTLLSVLFAVFLPALVSFYEQDPPPVLVSAARFGAALASGIPILGTSREFPVALILPLVMLGLTLFVWNRSRRARTLGIPPAGRLLGWLPWAGRSLRSAHQSAVAEVFGLLVAHDVPLGEALVLTAECTGNATNRRTSERLAGQMQQGRTPDTQELAAAGLPSGLASLVAAGASQPTLVSMADHLADFHRRQAVGAARQLNDWFPVLLIAVVGSLIGLAFCLSFFVPFSQFLQAVSGISNPNLRVHP